MVGYQPWCCLGGFSFSANRIEEPKSMVDYPTDDNFYAQGDDEGTSDTPFSNETFLENIGTEPGDDLAEAVRIGMADHSEMAGATVDPDADHMAADLPPTGGGLTSLPEQAKVVGDEAVGGTVSLPDQDVVDDIADSMGVTVPDEQPLNVIDQMYDRDEQRWELDPESEGRPVELEPFE